MQQIADWLEKLGMSEYAQRFAENRIDFSVLPDLTDQHLNDLGLPLGDRLKMPPVFFNLRFLSSRAIFILSTIKTRLSEYFPQQLW